jgi:hypothetical protein
VYDALLATAAKSLSTAISGRWDGWHEVSYGRDADGGGAIHLSFDRKHKPALRVASHYQDYPIHLHPGAHPDA